MKTEPMSMQDYPELRGNGARPSEEATAIKQMLPNTAMVITDSSLGCNKGNNCSFQSITARYSRTDATRRWELRHTPEGHAIACFPKETA